MKRLFSVLFLVIGLVSWASAQQPAQAQPSPAATASDKVGAGGAIITIVYHQPGVKGRKIFGGLVPYGEVWRTGANEATTFECSGDVKVGGKVLKKGKYSLFTIPNEKGNWTVIFNKTVNQWGAYDYKAADDVLRIEAKTSKADKMYERMTFNVEKFNVELLWDNLEVEFTIDTI